MIVIVCLCCTEIIFPNSNWKFNLNNNNKMVCNAIMMIVMMMMLLCTHTPHLVWENYFFMRDFQFNFKCVLWLSTQTEEFRLFYFFLLEKFRFLLLLANTFVVLCALCVCALVRNLICNSLFFYLVLVCLYNASLLINALFDENIKWKYV